MKQPPPPPPPAFALPPPPDAPPELADEVGCEPTLASTLMVTVEERSCAVALPGEPTAVTVYVTLSPGLTPRSV